MFRLSAVGCLASAVQGQITPAEVVEIGKELYEAVKDNQPVINVETDWAGAVPKGIVAWTDLQNWEDPIKSDSFSMEFKNAVGMKLTRFEWSFAWKYGGDYQGVGKYVTQAGIQVSDAYAYVSEHLDVSVQSLKPLNYGTAASPIGGLDVTVSVTSHGLFEKTTKSCTMTLKGDGSSVLGACETGSFVSAEVPAEASVAVGAITPSEVIQIGEALYQAVKDNQPVIDVSKDWAAAVPKGITQWTQLQNWEEPKTSEPFYVEFRNAVGMKLTRFAWSFAWKYGGDYQGVGKYVTQAGIQISDAYAYVSEHLDVSVQSLKPLNYGTTDSPVGGLDVIVSITSHGLFEKATKTCTMTLKGDGSSVLGSCESGKFDSPAPGAVVV